MCCGERGRGSRQFGWGPAEVERVSAVLWKRLQGWLDGPPGAIGSPHSVQGRATGRAGGMGEAKVAGLQHWRYHVPALGLPLRGSSQQSLVSEKAAQSSVTPDQTRAISAHHGCLSCRVTFSTLGFSYGLQCETTILDNETSFRETLEKW